MTKITFPQYNVAASVKYICKCGYKFTRRNTDYYTLNPFNKLQTHEENRKKVMEEIKTRVRICPKCKKQVKPVKK